VRSFLLYTAARFGLFLGAFGLIWLVGGFFLPWTSQNIVWTGVLAVVLSAIASLFLLRGLRDSFAQVARARAEEMSARLERARSKEDVDDVD
jgi:ABC-type bacteriocin/lantibiotic exporter with double-glycine peptidase domain